MYEQLSSSEQEKFDQVYNEMAKRFQKVSTNDKQRRQGVKLLQEERKQSGYLPMKTAKSLQVTEVLRRSNRKVESRTRQISRDDIREMDNDRWKGRRSENPDRSETIHWRKTSAIVQSGQVHQRLHQARSRVQTARPAGQFAHIRRLSIPGEFSAC